LTKKATSSTNIIEKMTMKRTILSSIILFVMIMITTTPLYSCCVSAFAPINVIQQQQQRAGTSSSIPITSTSTYSTVLQKLGRFEQRSMNNKTPYNNSLRTRVRMEFLFGLGGPELVVILIAAAFLLGPEKLAELGKDAGKIAGELKEVPKEFQAGLAEGEAQARALKSQQTTDTSSSTTTPATTVEVTKTEETK
jgi:sec-independent protein translocase protein TatA